MRSFRFRKTHAQFKQESLILACLMCASGVIMGYTWKMIEARQESVKRINACLASANNEIRKCQGVMK